MLHSTTVCLTHRSLSEAARCTIPKHRDRSMLARTRNAACGQYTRVNKKEMQHRPMLHDKHESSSLTSTNFCRGDCKNVSRCWSTERLRLDPYTSTRVMSVCVFRRTRVNQISNDRIRACWRFWIGAETHRHIDT